MIIDEYALIPDVFDRAAYSKPDYIDMCLRHLEGVLFQEAVVRDLGSGRWSAYCRSGEKLNRLLAAEILRKLKQANRLHPFPMQSTTHPSCVNEWCREALQSHNVSQLTGIIAAHGTKQQYPDDDIVASIERLTDSKWWESRSCSIELDRKTADYGRALRTLLECANSLMFIDPNFDPQSHNYRQFHCLLNPLRQRNPVPLIEIHRSFCFGDGRARKFLKDHEWEGRFAPLSGDLKKLGLSADIFLWSDFHARYLVTDLIGLVAEAGFDVTGKTNDLTTWARLGRIHTDDIRRRYDPGNLSNLKYQFRIGNLGSLKGPGSQ